MAEVWKVMSAPTLWTFPILLCKLPGACKPKITKKHPLYFFVLPGDHFLLFFGSLLLIKFRSQQWLLWECPSPKPDERLRQPGEAGEYLSNICQIFFNYFPNISQTFLQNLMRDYDNRERPGNIFQCNGILILHHICHFFSTLHIFG